MKKAITINVLRVSSNGKYIEFILSCPEDYYFTDFTIQVIGRNDKYSLADSLFICYDEEPNPYETVEEDGVYYWTKRYYCGQFKLEDIEVFDPEMFEIELIAHSQEELPIEEKAYISDVSNVYSCLMDDVLSLGNNLCVNTEVQDRLIRNYLILYAHEEAMRLKEVDDAKKYFSLLKNCFNLKNCSNTRSCGSCKDYTTYKPTNCGCKK